MVVVHALGHAGRDVDDGGAHVGPGGDGHLTLGVDGGNVVRLRLRSASLVTRAEHFRYFFICSIIKFIVFAFFIKLI